MTANFKQQVTAQQLVSELAVRTKLTCNYADVSGNPVALFGSQAAGGGGGGVRVLDQWAAIDGSASGFTDLPGFSASSYQPVYTTGVAQILFESTGDVTVAAVAASGTVQVTGDAGVGDKITVNGVDFTGGTNWTITGNIAADADALAVAINADPTTLVTAVSDGVDTVTLTATVVGPLGNNITLAKTEVVGTFVLSGAALTGGVGTPPGFIMPYDRLLAVIGECARRGLKVELYAVSAGVAPVFANIGVAAKQAEFFPNQYFALNSLV